jgi:signal transduction histidine kinase
MSIPVPTDDTEPLIRQLLALHKAALAITGELELDLVLQRIVDAARELANCKYSALGVLGEDGYIEHFPTSGISDLDREKIGEPPRGHGLLGVMLRAGRSLRIPDIAKDPRRVGFPPHHPPMTSLMGVPIFVQGKLVGDLYLTDKIGAEEFSEEDEWLLQLLATHAATALTNAQLHEANLAALQRAKLERTRSDALFAVTEAINRSVQIDKVISLILKSASELLGASAAAVYLMEQVPKEPEPAPGAGKQLPKSNPVTDGNPVPLGQQGQGQQGQQEQRGRFVARYHVGLEASPAAETIRLPAEGSVAGRALRSGMTQEVRDTHDEPDLIFPRLERGELRSLVVVPLIIGDRSLGVLGAYWDRPSAFDVEAVRLQEAFAAVASAAINNARLFDEAQKGREAAEKEQQRLREVEQMKDEFLSTAAHELRTPLTAVRMAASLLYEQIESQVMGSVQGEGSGQGGALDRESGTDDKLNARLLDLAGLVEEGSARVHSLVNDLLDLTRLEQGRAILHMEEFDLREAVEAAVESTGPLLESKEQPIILRLPELGCLVRGDRGRLEQVLINLLSNANKYSPPGSPVEVRMSRSTRADGERECIVSVRDSGPGVPEEERELIFDRFYRSSLHRKDRTPSTGLGLPIARKVAEMHQGRVWVEPGPGGGSIFTLALPASGW